MYSSSLPDTSKVEYTLYLIGDAGEPKTDGPDPVFTELKNELDKLPDQSAIVFLGDNIYPVGLPDPAENKEAYDIAATKLNVQLDAVKDFRGEVYFISGNHDWKKGKPGGLAQVSRQEKYVEEYLDRGNIFLPNAGCPGPVTRELRDDIVLVFLDSQWFLHRMGQEDIEDLDCKRENVLEVEEKLKEILDEYDDENVVIVAHHPVFTYGEHGGYYTMKDHLFPLTNLNESLWIPLPGLGSIYPMYRSVFGHIQDLPHPVNKDYQDLLLNSFYEYRNIIMASGHEHNLQHIEYNGNQFIVSGSGSKTTNVKKGEFSHFAASEKGYARVLFMSNGSVRLEFHAPGKGIIYSAQLKDRAFNVPESVTPYTLDTQTVTIPASQRYEKSSLHKFFFGKHYRDEWSAPVTIRSINLSREKGGLTPIKKGGGFASLSLRLEDPNEDQYVLRSVDKNIYKIVPEQFRNTVAQTIIQDQIAASHPYGALAVPKLAHAAGVYHTNPEIVYLSHQAALGDYNKDFAGSMYLFEERPAGNLKENDHFGNSKKIVSYTDVLDEITDNSDAKVNQHQVLRSRIFDILLGDWDRHDDQWRWARFEEEDPYEKDERIKVFEPIPRDRDQVFYIYKGFIPWLARQTPALKKFQSFDHDIGNVIALNFNARHFDRTFLTQLNRDDWKTMSEELKSSLTDSAIDQAVKDLPPEIYQIGGEEIASKLKSRRNKLEEYALDYYDYLSDYVDVVGTDKMEYFEVVRNSDQTTRVRVHKLTKSGNKEDLIYERTFIPSETKEIRLYGLKDDDVFEVSGTQSDGVLIRIIGGEGNDMISDQSSVRGSSKKTVVYDSLEGNDTDFGSEVDDKRSNDPADNQYNRHEYYYGTNFLIPYISYNNDDGLILTGFYTGTRYGFRKLPYRFRNQLILKFTGSSKEVSAEYGMEYLDVWGNADFRFDVKAFIPNDINNFFGLGNETDYDNTLDIDFFRYNQYSIDLRPAIQFKSRHEFHQLRLGTFYGYRKLKSSQEGFIYDFDRNGLSPEDFEADHLTGFWVQYEMNRTDNPVNPGLGVRLSFTPEYTINLSDSNSDFARLAGSLTVYNFIDLPDPVVLATKIQGAINFGDYAFYQANYLGKDEGLRAFRKNRFGGKASFVFSNDLRIRLFESKNYVMPFQFGITGSYDYGRVWNQDNSDMWHNSYGGGIWFSPYDAAVISLNYMESNEDENLFSLSFGFNF